MLTIARHSLTAAIAAATHVVPKRTPKDVLKYVRIISDGAGSRLHATSYESSLTYQLEGHGDATDILIPFEYLQSFVRATRGEQVEIEATDSGCNLRSGKHAKTKVSTADVDEFPMPQEFSGRTLTLPAAKFCEGIRRVSFATDDESKNYALDGFSFDMSGDELFFASTDGRRMISHRLPGVEFDKNEQSTILPESSFRPLITLLADGDVAVVVGDSNLSVSSSEWEYRTRLVEGRFPAWRQLVNQDRPISFECVAGDFLAIVRTASLVAGKSISSKGITLVFKDGEVTATGHSETGDESVDSCSVDGSEDCEFCLDGGFVMDFLRLLADDATVTIGATDNGSMVGLVEGESKYMVAPIAVDKNAKKKETAGAA